MQHPALGCRRLLLASSVAQLWQLVYSWGWATLHSSAWECPLHASVLLSSAYPSHDVGFQLCLLPPVGSVWPIVYCVRLYFRLENMM